MLENHSKPEQIETLKNYAESSNVRALAEALGVDLAGWTRSINIWPGNCAVLEVVMKRVMVENKSGMLTELLSIIADKFIETWTSLPSWQKDSSNYSNWSHSLCHNFERFDSRRSGSSLLDFPHQDEISERLLSAALDGAILTDSQGCIGRIIGPIIDRNLSEYGTEVNKTSPSGSFLPDCLRNPSAEKFLYSTLQELLSGEVVGEVLSRKFQSFAASSRSLDELIPEYLTPSQVIQVLEAYGPSFEPSVLEKFLSAVAKGEAVAPTVEELSRRHQMSIGAKDFVEGIYVDCQGTLLYSSNRLNESLHTSLVELLDQGEKVTVFTGADPHAMEEILKSVGADPRLLPVVSKEGFKGKLLECLIDDTKPEYQGFGALNTPSHSSWSMDTLAREGGIWKWVRRPNN